MSSVNIYTLVRMITRYRYCMRSQYLKMMQLLLLDWAIISLISSMSCLYTIKPTFLTLKAWAYNQIQPPYEWLHSHQVDSSLLSYSQKNIQGEYKAAKGDLIQSEQIYDLRIWNIWNFQFYWRRYNNPSIYLLDEDNGVKKKRTQPFQSTYYKNESHEFTVVPALWWLNHLGISYLGITILMVAGNEVLHALMDTSIPLKPNMIHSMQV